MIPHPDFNIWEHTRETLFEMYAGRARNELPEMTCHKQAALLLAPHLQKAMSILDAGCGSGYLFWSFYNRGLEVEYYGLDYTASFIEIGRQNIPSEVLPPERLQVGSIENIEARFDAVFCINTLFCLPDYRQGLERLAASARRFLILRTALGEETVIRYETDDYLDEGFRGPGGLRSYFNIWARDEVMDFITDLGFEVSPVVDEWTGNEPEISAGKVFPWRFLFCRRRDR